MATKQKDKATSKPRQRSSRKVVPQSEKLDQVQSPKLDPEIEEPIVPEVAAIDAGAIDEAVAVEEDTSVEFVPTEISVPADQPLIAEVIPVIIPPTESAATPVETAAAADHVSVGIHSIASAYKTYANKSLEQTGSFVEKLMSARSFDKAAEIQIEFARQAYANLIAESQNICQLYSRLTGQMFQSWQGLAMSARAR